jgi:hypothetical protein
MVPELYILALLKLVVFELVCVVPKIVNVDTARLVIVAFNAFMNTDDKLDVFIFVVLFPRMMEVIDGSVPMFNVALIDVGP